MKLPEWDDLAAETLGHTITSFKLACLHIARSIAVSMEVIAREAIWKGTSQMPGSRPYGLEALAKVSVREVPDGDAGAD